MKTKNLFKLNNLLRCIATGALISTIGCSDENTELENELSSSNQNSLSSKSVELPVISVSASTQQSSNPASNVIDGDTSNRWSGYGTSASLYFDLGIEQTIDYVEIDYYKGNQREAYFSYWSSDDGVNWNWKGSKTSSGTTDTFEIFDLRNMNSRYLRIKCQGTSTGQWNSINEIKIYGTDNSNEQVETCTASIPSGRNANATENSVTLSWNAVNNIDHYNVRYREEGTSSWNYVYTIRETSTIINDLSSNTDYEWQIRAKCASGDATSYNDAESYFSTSENINNIDTNPISGTNPWDFFINCNQWKITYTDGSEEKELCDQAATPEYYVSAEGDALVFEVTIDENNGTTTNSSYVRSELREREADGSKDIYWTTDGDHALYINESINRLNIEKNHIVAGQIHGNKDEGIDDSMVLRLEGDHMFLSFNGGQLREDLTIMRGYNLGDKFEVIFRIIDGKHYCYFSTDGNLRNAYNNGNANNYLVTDNGNTVLLDLDYDETYFKVGNYAQTNLEREGSSAGSNNYSQVYVYAFNVNHNGGNL